MQRLRTMIAVGAAAAACALSAGGDVPTVRVEQFAAGFERPVEFVPHPSDASVHFVCEQFTGRIRIIHDGKVRQQAFLDVSDRMIQSPGNHQGLLGVAFPDDYETTGVFYVNYISPGHASRISRFSRDPDDPFRADPDSEEIILSVEQPLRVHNAGRILFGPDGMLYIMLGDGGGVGDPSHNAQNPETLLGKIIRIDVSTDAGYAIPPDNPFVDDDPVDALEEIWAFGVRNPWKASFDDPSRGGTGAFVFADVGEFDREEINYEPAGAGGRNYGWRLREGFREFDVSEPAAYEPLTDPILDYQHGAGPNAAIGGFIYRGDALPAGFDGRYFFADFNERRIWSLGLELDEDGEATAADVVEHTDMFGGSNAIGGVVGFGQDLEGEIYLLSFNGVIYRVVPDETVTLDSFELATGTLLEGDVADLRASDDAFVRTRSGFGQSFTERHLTNLVVRATTAVESPTTIEVAVQSRIDQPLGQGRILLRDWDTGEFDAAGAFVLSAEETVAVFSDLDASRYVSGEGEIELSIRHVVFVPFLAFSFESFFDQVYVVVD